MAAASTRWLVGIAVAVALVVVGSAAIALAARGEQQFDAGTPEGAVQRYLRALNERDASTALTYFAPSLLEDCDEQAFRSSIDQPWIRRFRAALDETSEQNGRTQVRVRITQFYSDGPFGGGEGTFEQSFLLEQVEGDWRFVEAPWPTWCSPLRPGTPNTR